MNIAKLPLYPLAVFYNLGTKLRNYLYDGGFKRSTRFGTTVIAVGNLNVGGSGKTPMVEYLIRQLKESCSVVTLSRGYGRSTTGYRIAQNTDSAATVGDEPMQFFKKFGSEIKVGVGEDRVPAIHEILQTFPETGVILLDDAFQHRSVISQLSILVTDYSSPFYDDFVLPFGRLREARAGAKRADVIVVTKCKEGLSSGDRDKMVQAIQQHAPATPVFFSSIRYHNPIPIGHSNKMSRAVVVVSGIARTEPLLAFCSSAYSVIKHFDYPDHHRYSADDLAGIKTFCMNQAQPVSLLTTEKDMVKLTEPALKPHLDGLPWFYLPIEQVFLEDGLKFDELIFRAVNKPAGN
jgi:tetraacyldisaccharide 4'-kinase